MISFNLPTKPDGDFYSIPETNELLKRVLDDTVQKGEPLTVDETKTMLPAGIIKYLGSVAGNKSAEITVPDGVQGLLIIGQRASTLTRWGLYGIGANPSNHTAFAAPFHAQTSGTLTTGSNKITYANGTAYESYIFSITLDELTFKNIES